MNCTKCNKEATDLILIGDADLCEDCGEELCTRVKRLIINSYIVHTITNFYKSDKK